MVNIELLSFRVVSLIISAIAAILFLSLLLNPELMFWASGIEGNAAAYFIARKSAMLFLGYAVIFYFARNTQHSMTRQSILLGLVLTMAGLAIMGIFEYAKGFAGSGIFLAITLEILLAGACFCVWFENRKLSRWIG